MVADLIMAVPYLDWMTNIALAVIGLGIGFVFAEVSAIAAPAAPEQHLDTATMQWWREATESARADYDEAAAAAWADYADAIRDARGDDMSWSTT